MDPRPEEWTVSCTDPRFQRAIEALGDGELAGPEYAALRQHLTGCAPCRAHYERLSQLETHLERRALPQARQDLLEAELFSRLGIGRPPQAGATVHRPARWNLRRVAAVALPLAASVAFALLVAPRLLSPGEEAYQARGGAPSARFGVRAFCVSPGGAVTAEAGPGETLACAQGSAVQFNHTNDTPGALTLTGEGAGPEPLTFFPLAGAPGTVPAGTDLALPHSTPVTEAWLSGRIRVTATLRDSDGGVVGQSQLQLEPAP